MEIALISGKGGTGKSSVSAAFATFSEQTLLADCDVDAANLHLIFYPAHQAEHIYIGGQHAVINHKKCNNCGLCKTYCRFSAVQNYLHTYKIDEILCDGCHLCARICPQKAITMVSNDKSRMYEGTFRYGHMVYGRLAPGEENSGKLVNMVRAKATDLAKLHGHTQIIIDGPPGIGCATISSITGADAVVVVTEPTVSGIHDMKRALETIKKFNIKAWIIINKYDLNTDMSMEIENYCHEQDLPIAGKLPFDALVTEAMVQCKAITEWAPDAEISKILKQCWQTVTNYLSSENPNQHLKQI